MFILICCILFMIAEFVFTYSVKFYKKPNDELVIASCILTSVICCIIVFGYEMRNIVPNQASYVIGIIFNIAALPAGFLVSYVIILILSIVYTKIKSVIELLKIKIKKYRLQKKGSDKFYKEYIIYSLYNDILSNSYICSNSKIHKKVQFILKSITHITESSSVYNDVTLEILKRILNLANMYECNINIVPSEAAPNIKLSREEINERFLSFLQKTETQIIEIINNTVNFNNLKIDKESFILKEQIEILKK